MRSVKEWEIKKGGEKMLENILKSVTEAEAKADTIILQAEQDALGMVEEAKQQALKMREETISQLKVSNQELLKSMQAMSNEKLSEAAVIAQKEADALKASVFSKKQEAIEEVITMMI